MSSITVMAEVDIDDVLCDVGVEDLSKYLRSGLTLDDRIRLAKAILVERPGERSGEDDGGMGQFLNEALALLRAGRADDAELLLERVAHPKWQSAEAALIAFKALS